MLQGLVELNIQPSSTVSMDELESFWDSEAPRIGDAHPSLAGVSRWREAEEAAKAKLPVLATGSEQEHVVRLARGHANVLNTTISPRPQANCCTRSCPICLLLWLPVFFFYRQCGSHFHPCFRSLAWRYVPCRLQLRVCTLLIASMLVSSCEMTPLR